MVAAMLCFFSSSKDFFRYAIVRARAAGSTSNGTPKRIACTPRRAIAAAGNCSADCFGNWFGADAPGSARTIEVMNWRPRPGRSKSSA